MEKSSYVGPAEWGQEGSYKRAAMPVLRNGNEAVHINVQLYESSEVALTLTDSPRELPLVKLVCLFFA